VTDDTQSRFEQFTDALAGGDLDVLPSFLADSFFSYEPGPDEPTAAKRFAVIVSDLKEAMPDLTVSIGEVEQSGDVFTATMTVTGTYENALWGAPPTGKQISWTNPVSIKPIGDRFAVRFDEVTLPSVIGVLRELGMVNAPDEMDRAPLYPVSPPAFLLKVLFTGQAGNKPCTHLDQIEVTEPGTRACAKCVAVGDYWPALRMCLTCGHVGCCDTSINKHANQHYQESGHPLMRSIRMDEEWVWCYEDSAFFEGRILDPHR
jgi:predicted ester cyclase